MSWKSLRRDAPDFGSSNRAGNSESKGRRYAETDQTQMHHSHCGALALALAVAGCRFRTSGDGSGGGALGADGGSLGSGGTSPFASKSEGSTGDSPFGAQGGSEGSGSSPLSGESSGGSSDSPLGSSGTGSSSGGVEVDGSREIGALSSSEKQQVCVAATEEILDELSTEEICLLQGYVEAAFQSEQEGVTDEQLRTSCSETQEGCVEEQNFSAEDNCGSVPGGGSCSATVDDWLGCERALNDAFAKSVRDLPQCSELTTGEYTGDERDFEGADETPSECTAIQEECPEFYESNVGPTNSSSGTEPGDTVDVGVQSDGSVVGSGDVGVD